MSGGYWDYIQHPLPSVAMDAYKVVMDGGHKYNDYDGSVMIEEYNETTLARFAEARDTILKASKMIQRMDWLLSGDDGEDCFNRRWEEELGNA